jgi:hypothetical protein
MADGLTDKPSSKSQTRGCGSAALLLVIVISAWIYFGYRQSNYLLPPAGTDTFGDLAFAPPPTRKLSVIEDGGARYIVWIGRTRTVMVASGPPVYVFDLAGNPVDRSIDVGDCGDDRLRRYFSQAMEAPEVTFKDALGLLSVKELD